MCEDSRRRETTQQHDTSSIVFDKVYSSSSSSPRELTLYSTKGLPKRVSLKKRGNSQESLNTLFPKTLNYLCI